MELARFIQSLEAIQAQLIGNGAINTNIEQDPDGLRITAKNFHAETILTGLVFITDEGLEVEVDR